MQRTREYSTSAACRTRAALGSRPLTTCVALRDEGRLSSPVCVVLEMVLSKMVTLTVDDRLLSAYLFYGSVLMLKTWVMSFLTARHRIKNKALPSPEDYRTKRDKPVPVNEDVERVNRAHRNDLENIPIFMIVASLYMFSNLPPTRAIWCLRIFTVARMTHTIAYLNAVSYPRAIGFGVGALCTAVLGGSVLYSAVKPGVF